MLPAKPPRTTRGSFELALQKREMDPELSVQEGCLYFVGDCVGYGFEEEGDWGFSDFFLSLLVYSQSLFIIDTWSVY